MAEAICGECGGAVLYEATLATPGARVTCPRCSTDIEVDGLSDHGAETILVPEARAATGPESGPGTMLLRSDSVGGSGPSVDVKVRGFLTQDGLPPAEADFRLRSGATVVGREQGAIRVADAALSARHFQIEERSSDFFLRDLGSSNGTLLNGHRVRSAKLESGDRITAGGTTFTFSVRHLIPM